MICDFCNAPNPVWRFSARPFVVDYGTMASASDADWAACDACRDLILADDRNGLVDRAMVTAPVIPGLADSEVRDGLDHLWHAVNHLRAVVGRRWEAADFAAFQHSHAISPWHGDRRYLDGRRDLGNGYTRHNRLLLG